MAQRGHQPVAGPSSPSKASRSQHQQNRQPRQTEDASAVDYSGYGYGKYSEFGTKRPGQPGHRRAPYGAPFTNGHAPAYANMQPGIPFGHQYYAASAPLPPNGAPLPPQQGYQVPPPTGPKSLKQDSSRLQFLPGSNNLYMATASTSRPLDMNAVPRHVVSPVPPLLSSNNHHSSPPPPPLYAASTATSSSSQPAVPPLPPGSPSSVPPPPSAPRAMLKGSSTSLKGKGSASPSITINVSDKVVSRSSQLDRSGINGSSEQASVPTAETLARAALAKSSTVSSASQPSPPINAVNGRPPARKGVMSIAIANPSGPKIAYPVRAVKGQVAASKAKPVNILELAEKKKEKERQAELEAKQAAAQEAAHEDVDTDVKGREATKDQDDLGPRYTPPPRNRVSRWDRPDSATSQSIEARASPSTPPTSLPRSHTPPSRATRSSDIVHTLPLPPPPPSEAPISPPPPPPPPLPPPNESVCQGKPVVRPSSPTPPSSTEESANSLPPASETPAKVNEKHPAATVNTPSSSLILKETLDISVSSVSEKASIAVEEPIAQVVAQKERSRHPTPSRPEAADTAHDTHSRPGVTEEIGRPADAAVRAVPKERDWIIVYDPKCDQSPVKQSKGPIFRYAGKDVERPVQDPRQSESAYNARLAAMKAKKTVHIRNKLLKVSYRFDEFSCGKPPLPPPSAVLVTGLTVLTTIEKVRAHFASYGTIEEAELKVDDRTGGSLGICWIKYSDNITRTIYTREGKSQQTGSPDGQDGHACALLAVQRSHNLKIATLTGNDGKLKVVMDGQGELCKRQVKAVLDRKRGKVPLPPAAAKKAEGDSNAAAAEIRLVPHASLPAKPSPVNESSRLSRSPEQPNKRAVLESSSTSRIENHDRQPDQFRSRTPAGHASPQRRPQTMTSPARAREPYRLPSYASRAQRDQVKKRGNTPSDRAQSVLESESESESDNESDDAVSRRLRDDDKVYGPGTRHSRRPASLHNSSVPSFARSAVPSAPPSLQISSHYRQKIDAYKKLAEQSFPYLIIEKKHLAIFTTRGQRVNDQLVKGHFGANQPKEVFDDAECFYATFRRSDGAHKAYYACSNKKFLHVEVPIQLIDSLPTNEMVEALVAEAQENARQQAELAAAAPSQPMVVRKDAARDIVLEARAIILRDLRTSFENDLRKRLAATHIANGWSNHEAQKDRAAPVQDRPTMSPTKPDDRPAHPTRASEDTFKRRPEVPPPAPASRPEERAIKAPLPSFGRQAELAASRSVSLNQRQYSSAACRGNLNEDTPSRPHSPTIPTSLSEKYDDVGIGPKSSATRLKRARSEKTKSSKKKNKSYKVEQLHFTSSEEEDEGDNDIASDRKVGPTVELAPVEKESQVDVQQVKEEEDIPDSELLHIIIPNKQEDQAPLEAVITLPTPTASESNVSSAKRELSEAPEETAKRPRLGSATPSQSTPQSEILTTEPPATETAVKPVKSTTRKPAAKGKGRGKRGAKQKKKRSESPPRPQVNLLSDLVTNGDQEDRFYLKLALSRIRAGHGALPADDMKEQEEDAIEELEIVEPRHETGCARTEGYYKIPQPEKLRYLLARNQAKEDSNKEGHSSLSISRLARANARHLASGLDKHKKATATDTDLLQLNQLRTRKKQLRFARSPIHDWGLYALELIPAGEMVIEYVGEQIRQQVADKREKGYERQGIGSSYLFRVDDDVVIDATMKGNLGRLINHCCTPNCTAKILSVGNSKKIVIYAKQVINKGDEITYDYHFPIEDEKIVCLCGSSGCRGFLN